MTTVPSVYPIVSATPAGDARTLLPQLRWPSLDAGQSPVDLDRFPTRNDEVWRHSMGEFGAWSDAFMEPLFAGPGIASV